MSLADAIHVIAPNAVGDVDYLVIDRSDGQGPQLARWDEAKLGLRPTQAQLDAASTQIAAEQTRIAGIKSDADLLDLLNRLRTATASQLKAHIANNVTDLATAKAALTKVVLLLALVAKE